MNIYSTQNLFLIYLILFFFISEQTFAEINLKPEKKNYTTLLEDIPCEKEALDLIAKWTTTYNWRKIDSSGSVKTPTDKTGEWVKLFVDKKKSKLIKVSP